LAVTGLVFTQSPYVLSVLAYIGLFAIPVMGLVLILGLAGQIALGHAAFMGLGAYTSAILTKHVDWPPLAALVATTLVVAVVAFVAGKPILRLRGFYLALATMAFAIIVDSVLVGWSELTEGPSGFVGIPPFGVAGLQVTGELGGFLLVAVLVLLFLWLTLNVQNSLTGVVLRALHRDEDVALTLGIDVARLKTAVFVLGAVYAGVGGAFYAHYARFISPETFGLQASFEMLLVAMLGGAWTAYGAVMGAAILKFLPEALAAFQDYRLMAYGLVFMLIPFHFPDGLAGALRDFQARRGTRGRPGRTIRAHGPTLAFAPLPAAQCRPSAQSPALLTVERLSKTFRGLQAVHEVSFEVREQSITALIGPNGAGKTTVINVVTGLVPPSGGRVLFASEAITGREPWEIARRGIARTFQNVRLFGDLSVLENTVGGYYRRAGTGLAAAALGTLRARAESRAAESEAQVLLDSLGLGDYRERRASELPFGSQRLLEIARALMGRPRLLLLDEPAAGLNDAETEALGHMLNGINACGVTVLLVEHNMYVVKAISSHVVVLNYGQKLAEGPPDVVLEDAGVIEAYLGRRINRAAR
jgi:branched-chain amino acid transport system permease protein